MESNKCKVPLDGTSNHKILLMSQIGVKLNFMETDHQVITS